jgi:spore coat polysaccharide biosynthesis protein SpsF (cytidylyltransferase family)
MNQFFEFFSKKFKSEVKSESDIENTLKDYEDLNIAVRHADTFLKNETSTKHDEIIKLLEKFGIVKQTGKKKL